MKLVNKLIFTAASLALCFSSLDVQSASAAIVNYAFTVDSPTKTGKGVFSFDDSTVSSGIFSEVIVKSLFFQFDGDSSIYTEKDDIAYPSFPVVSLTPSTTGKPSVELSYFFFDKANPDAFLYEIVGEDFTILDGTFQNTEIGFGKVTYTKVPEPTTISGAVIVCGLSLIVKRKARQIKKVKA